MFDRAGDATRASVSGFTESPTSTALFSLEVVAALAIGAAVGGITGALVSVPLTAATTATSAAVRTPQTAAEEFEAEG